MYIGTVMTCGNSNKKHNYIIHVSPNTSSNASTSDFAGYADANSDACHADFLLFLFSERKALIIAGFKSE